MNDPSKRYKVRLRDASVEESTSTAGVQLKGALKEHTASETLGPSQLHFCFLDVKKASPL